MRNNAVLLNTALALIAMAVAACDRDTDAEHALGTVEYDRIELAAPATEIITRFGAREGERVSAGTVMVQLDDRRLAAEAERLEADRERLAARLAEVVRGPRDETVAALRAQLAGATAELDDARADLQRQRELRLQGLNSAADLDRAQARSGRAEAERDVALKNLEAAVEGSTAEELDQARSALHAAEAALRANQVERERLQLTAPRDGLVETLPYEVGELPPAGAVLAILLDTSRPYARVYLPASHRGQLTTGDSLSVRLGEQVIQGTVHRISADPVFTPYYALTEEDRSHLSYLAEVDLPPDLAPAYAGSPVEVMLP